MRTVKRRCVQNLLRSRLCVTIVLASFTVISHAHADFEDILAEILKAREAPSGVENVVAKMLEKQEVKAARRLDVWQCMSIALDQNKEIKEAWHLLQQTQVGDRIITRSRLFPQLELIVNHTNVDSDTSAAEYDDTQSVLRLSQRILEYGKDSPEEVSLRASQRSALYNLESTVRRVLAQVRQDFYVILLREEQIMKRMELLEEFRLDWIKKRARLQAREPSVDPSDVLQAEANVMNELGSINSLLRDQARLKIGLLQLMGESSGQNIELVGTQDETIFDVEEAVRVALENSIEVARFEEEMEEQERLLRQLLWEFAPDVNLQTGVSRRGEDVALNLSNSGDTWAADVTGERLFEPGDVRNEQFVLNDDEDFFLNLEMRLPILEGFARVGRLKRERERLKQTEARVQRAGELAELDVRQRYESLLDNAMDVQLRAQQVAISRRLFDIQNELRERLPARVSEQQFETFRNRYFNDQDRLFSAQASFIETRESLREAMGQFE